MISEETKIQLEISALEREFRAMRNTLAECVVSDGRLSIPNEKVISALHVWADNLDYIDSRITVLQGQLKLLRNPPDPKPTKVDFPTKAEPRPDAPNTPVTGHDRFPSKPKL